MKFVLFLLAFIACAFATTSSSCTVCSYVCEVAELAVKYEGFNTTALEGYFDQICSLPIISSYKAECEALVGAEAGPLAKCIASGSPADQCCQMVDACPTAKNPAAKVIQNVRKHFNKH